MQAFTRSWWLLALAAVFEAMYAIINLVMQRPDGSLALRTFALRPTVQHMGLLAIAAGVCIVACGIWGGRRPGTWPVIVNGAAFTTLGLILRFWKGPLGFRTIALLLIVMALSLGTAALREVGRSSVGRLASVILGGFALMFLVLGLGWFRPVGPEWLNVWMGAFFGFSALCLATFAMRLRALN
jgi:hypothetical protein